MIAEKKDIRELSESFRNPYYQTDQMRAVNNRRFIRNAPESAKDLCMKLLIQDPNKRLSFEQIKFHPFFFEDFSKKITPPKYTVC